MWKQIFGQSPNPRKKDYAKLAKRLLKEKKWEAAIEAYTLAIEQTPNSSQLYLERGLVHTILNQHETAIADYDLAIQLDPSNFRAYLCRSKWYRNKKQYKRALQDLDKAFKVMINPVPIYIEQAKIYEEMGLYDDALHVLNLAAHAHDYPIELYVIRGAIYAEQDNWKAALEDYTYLYNREPANPIYNIRLAMCWIELKDPAKALPYLDMAISAKFELQDIYPERAKVNGLLDKWEAALDDAQKGVEVAPLSVRANHMLLVSYTKLKDYPKVIEHATKAIDSGLQHPIMYGMRAVAHLNLGNWEAVITDSEQALVLNPNDNFTHGYRAFAHYILSQFESALHYYNLAFDDKEEILTIWYRRRGETLFILGRLDDALTDLEIFMTKATEPYSPIATLAVIKFALGQKEAAFELWQSLLEVEKDCFSNAEAVAEALQWAKPLEETARALIAELPQNSE